MEYLKLTEELAADIKARVKTLDFKTIEKLRKAKDENGSFDVIISTEDIDRSGEIVRQDGWEMANYKNNPIVLWGHDYYSLPISTEPSPMAVSTLKSVHAKCQEIDAARAAKIAKRDVAADTAEEEREEEPAGIDYPKEDINPDDIPF